MGRGSGRKGRGRRNNHNHNYVPGDRAGSGEPQDHAMPNRVIDAPPLLSLPAQASSINFSTRFSKSTISREASSRSAHPQRDRPKHLQSLELNDAQRSPNRSEQPKEYQSAGEFVSDLLEILNRATPPLLSPVTLKQAYNAAFLGLQPADLNYETLKEARERLRSAVHAVKLARRNRHGAEFEAKALINNDVEVIMGDSPTTIGQFLGEISRILKSRDAVQLQDFLVIEPPYTQKYEAMVQEARAHFDASKEEALEAKCSTSLPEARESQEGGPAWTAFIKFMVSYFSFLRDVNINNLLDTYNILSDLVQKSNSALKHPTLGLILLPTVQTYSRLLARLAIGLEKQPHLIAHLRKPSLSSAMDDSSSSETLPERAANIIRESFTTCLNDRAGSTGSDKIGGKKKGIYKLANICLKILFSCKKTRNAEQIFTNIYNQAPPLDQYPRSERVTYLYYLGRFLFTVSHFTRSRLCLQQAYQDCHKKCLKQRRLILIYLIASSIICGRFPRPTLLSRPEASGLSEIFTPLTTAITKGDLASFRILTDLDAGGHVAQWLFSQRVLLQLRNRCEVLVWRSLCRQCFILKGSQGDQVARKAATLHLDDVLALRRGLELRADASINTSGPETSDAANGHNESASDDAIQSYIDPDFEGIYDYDEDGNPYFDTSDDEDDETQGTGVDMLEIESMLSSLISQGLLNGFISHRLKRFAILGSKTKGGPLAAGFPNPALVITSRMAEYDREVPGWRKEEVVVIGGGGGGAAAAAAAPVVGPGMVINLSGARPAGAKP